MKTFGNFAEDLDTRRQELKQRQQQQLGRFKQKGADVSQAAAQRSASQRDKAREAAERATAARDAIKQRRQAAADARAEAEAKKKEREDISAEIAASREEKIDQSEDEKKKNDSKRMAKDRVQEKRREAAEKAMREA